MNNWKAVALDYYQNGLNNAAIIEKHRLKRTKTHAHQERIYEYLPEYEYQDLKCSRCNGAFVANFVGKIF
jgi:hypothetical protein